MKSYFASSVQAAMKEARSELGADAILVTSRASGPEARHLGELEVVFATDVPEVAAAAAAPPAAEPASRPSAAPPAPADELSTEMREIRSHLATWQQSRARDIAQPSWMVGFDSLEESFAALLDADVDREWAVQLMAKTHRRLRSLTEPTVTDTARRLAAVRTPEDEWDAAQVRAALSEEIRGCFATDATLGSAGHGPRIVALVGPPGAGKTTTIAKLAIEYALPARKPSALISIDTLRVGAPDHLRSYASILGIAMTAVETNRALVQALEEHRNKEYIFIDTSGLGFRDLDHGRDLAELLATRPDIQTHLVLPASLRSTDMARMSAAYEMFQPSRLIFTRLDEASVAGPLFTEAARSGCPVSFFTDGQRVPEDLRAADAGEVAKRLVASSEERIARKLTAA